MHRGWHLKERSLESVGGTASRGSWKRCLLWPSKQLEKRNNNFGEAERQCKLLRVGWNGWALQGGEIGSQQRQAWGGKQSQQQTPDRDSRRNPCSCVLGLFSVSHYLQDSCSVCGSAWGRNELHPIEATPSLSVHWLGFEELRSGLFFFFSLSWKLLFSRHSSSPSSGYTGSILRTPLREARCGSELGGQRRALDRDGRGILMAYHQVICFVLYRWSGKSLLTSKNHTISLKSQCFRCSQWTKAIWCFLSLNIF